jgi:hypothetical protein
MATQRVLYMCHAPLLLPAGEQQTRIAASSELTAWCILQRSSGLVMMLFVDAWFDV